MSRRKMDLDYFTSKINFVYILHSLNKVDIDCKGNA